MRPTRIALIIAVTLVLLSCGSNEQDTLAREKLFELQIGRMEDQLDMLFLNGEPLRQKTRILMRNGLFYIANGNAAKVMEFSSYGDILSLYYNPEVNPSPILLHDSNTDTLSQQKKANRRAFEYHFREVGEIGINSEKMLLVEDKVSPIQQEFDSELQVMLNRVVLRFDADGRLVDYLGQEGPGGTPFPYIESLQVTERDEIVVIARSLERWLVYWFSKNGSLLYQVSLSRRNLPVPEGVELQPSLGSVQADIDERLLYLKVDYYGSDDEESSSSRNVRFHNSRIWWFDLERAEFLGSVGVPQNAEDLQISEFDEAKRVQILYELIGNTEGNVFFLMSHHAGDLFEIVLLKRDGKVLSRFYLEIPEKSVEFRDFHLSHDGILSALLVKEYLADVVWWRTDRILEDQSENS